MSIETAEEYKEAVRACHMAAAIVGQHDLDGVLRRIANAETMGPLLDPTLYREKGQAMREDKEVVEAALPLCRLAAKLNARDGQEVKT